MPQASWSKKTRKNEIPLHTKKRLKVFLFGTKAWRITEKYKKNVEAIQMNAIRRSSRLCKAGRVRNKVITERMRDSSRVTTNRKKKKKKTQDRITTYSYYT